LPPNKYDPAGPEKHPGITHLALAVSGLARQGIRVTEGPVALPDGSSMIFVRDPDNNVIEFHHSVTVASST